MDDDELDKQFHKEKEDSIQKEEEKPKINIIIGEGFMENF